MYVGIYLYRPVNPDVGLPPTTYLLFVFYLEVLAVASCQGGSGTTATS